MRDPRDVALSFAAAPIGPKEPHAIALAWQRDQQAALRAARESSSPRWVRVRYEDLVHRGEALLKELCQQLKLGYTPEMLDFNLSTEAVRAAQLSPLWANLSSRLTTSRVGRFRLAQHREFVTAVEEVVAAEMEVFGYEPLYRTRARDFTTAELMGFAQADDTLRRRSTDALDPEREAVFHRRDIFLQELRRTTP